MNFFYNSGASYEFCFPFKLSYNRMGSVGYHLGKRVILHDEVCFSFENSQNNMMLERPSCLIVLKNTERKV